MSETATTFNMFVISSKIVCASEYDVVLGRYLLIKSIPEGRTDNYIVKCKIYSVALLFHHGLVIQGSFRPLESLSLHKILYRYHADQEF